MALGDVKLIKENGGVGGELAGQDHITGLIFYSATYPSGFSVSDKIKNVFSIAQLEQLGVGEGSANFGIIHYHVSEYFRKSPNGNLFVSINPIPGTPATPSFTEIAEMVNFSLSTVRQIGIYYTDNVFVPAWLTTIDTIMKALYNENKYLDVVILSPNIQGITLSSLTDLQLRTDNQVGVLIAQDGGAKGKAIYDAMTIKKSVTCLGALMGTISIAPVNESVGFVKKYNVATTELDVIAFGNGVEYKTLTKTELDLLDSKHYIFLRKTDIAGSYFNYGHTATSEALDDYCTIERNRTMNKAIRGVRRFLAAEVNGPVVLQANGTMFPETVNYFNDLIGQPLEQMQASGEISAYQVLIDPAQNILTTNKLKFGIRIVPTGVNKTIEGTVGYALSVA